MSQNNIFPAVNETSLSSFNDNHDENNQTSSSNSVNNNDEDWKSAEDNDDANISEIQEDLTVLNNQQNDDVGWANFDTFDNNSFSDAKSAQVNLTNTDGNDWGNFESTSNTKESSNNQETVKVNNDDDDDFGDYGEVQITPQSQTSPEIMNSLNTESVETLISTCFPLESSIVSPDLDNNSLSELPNFTTCKTAIDSPPGFQPCLSLWNVLANVSNDPIGIQYQWRKSHIERIYHRSLGVQERFTIKTTASTSNTSSSPSRKISIDDNNENKSLPETVNPRFEWKQSGLENPLTACDVNKSLDLDFYIPTTQTSTLNKESETHSPIMVHRNNSPITQLNSKPIKTIDLFPGSSRIASEEAKPRNDSVPNFSSMNPKELFSETKNQQKTTNS